MKLVDSNVLVAWINKDDSLHGEAALLDLRDTVTNQLVFAEVANVLQKRVHDKSAVLRELKQVLENMQLIPLLEEDFWNALALFGNHYSRISFTDASMLAQSRKTGLEILSFDEQLNAIAGKS